MAGNFTRGVARENEESKDAPDTRYSALDLHLLYKTSGSFFFGGGASYTSYRTSPHVDIPDDDAFVVDGVAPSLRVGFFIPLESVVLMLDAVWHGEVSGDDFEDGHIAGEMSFTSYQISTTLLWNF